MYIQSTIHPYHSIEKSKVHPNQPFLKPICYYIRIEDRERERGKKRGKERRKKRGKIATKIAEIEKIQILFYSTNGYYFMAWNTS